MQHDPELKPQNSSPERVLPDISFEQQAQVEACLDQVGMDGIEMPIRISSASGSHFIPAKIDIKVSLDDPKAKGIHMSRLYRVLSDRLAGDSESPLIGADTRLQTGFLKSLMGEMIESQKGLSDGAFMKLAFELPLERLALKSQQKGWRQYPVEIEARQVKGELKLGFKIEVLYSSTCPCSAALSRQLVREQFAKDHSGQSRVEVSEVLKWLSKESSIIATPHAQRSVAEFRGWLSPEAFTPSLVEVIDSIEKALGTPVQSAVKREDEQEFARLNAANLMFCEDASRKLKALFDQDSRFSSYWIRVEHQESLHPHNAVSIVSSDS